MTTNQANLPSSTTSEQKIGMKNKQIKRKVDVHLLATDALVLLEERFL
jgi:hypothetical protein